MGLREWMTPNRADALRGIGLGLSQLGAGQPVNLQPMYASIQARREREKMREALGPILDRMPPEMRGVLASMPTALAQKYIMDNMMPKQIPRFQYGTDYAPGGRAIVGEDGPEEVILPRGAQVVPNPATMDPSGPTLQQSLGALPQGAVALQDANGPDNVFDDSRNFQVAQAAPTGDPGQMGALDVYRLISQTPEYDLSNLPEGKLSEGQSKLVGYLRNAMIADAMLSDPALQKAMTKVTNNIAGEFGALGRLYTNDDYELGHLAANMFSTAILRKESGAQTPEPEVLRYNRLYTPLSNETPEMIKAKAMLRREQIRSLQMALGTAQPLGAQIIAEIDALRESSSRELSDEEFLKELGLD